MIKDQSAEKCLNLAKEILGMDFSKANQILYRMLIFKLLKDKNENFCFRCKQEIKNFSQLSFDHIEDWGKTLDREFKPALFLDMNNIAFSHFKCNAASAKAFTGSSKYVGVRLFYDKRKNYKKWVAYRGKDTGSKFDYFGYHDNEKLAAHARDLGVIKFYNGEGLMNFLELRPLYDEIIKNGWGELKNGRKIDYKMHYSYFQ